MFSRPWRRGLVQLSLGSSKLPIEIPTQLIQDLLNVDVKGSYSQTISALITIIFKATKEGSRIFKSVFHIYFAEDLSSSTKAIRDMGVYVTFSQTFSVLTKTLP